MTSLDKLLRRMNACEDACEWAKSQPDLAIAWQACERADWLLWFAARLDVDRKTLVLAACACARTALKHVPEGEDRPRLAIETAERWVRGEVTIAEVRKAAHAATAATYAATAAAYAAINDATHAATAAYAAAYATDVAADVAADAAVRAQAHREMCVLIRQHFPTPPEAA